jgi:hypothetical protein
MDPAAVAKMDSVSMTSGLLDIGRLYAKKYLR